MAEYEAEFLRLSRYARGIVATKYERCRERDFAALVEKEKIAEDVKHSECQNYEKDTGRFMRDLELKFFWRHHLGKCWKKTGACFRCGSREHQLKDCPQRPTQMEAAGQGFVQPVRGGQQPPRGHGQVRSGNGVGRGRGTFGRGVGNRSTYSYIACTVSGTLGIICMSTIKKTTVLSPLGQSVRVDKLFRDVALEVQGVIFLTDLMELQFGDFGLIFGIDWLVKHHASLDCAAKRMVLKTTNDEEVVVIGERRDFLTNVISALRVEKLVRKGYEAFLAYINTSDSEGPSVGDVIIVKDFSDVLPDELPGLPPSREVEFGIELLPGTAPVSIAPYKMAPKDLVELKAQIQEL
ncbi:uncharacterized protein LOC128041712 [Gossypium raimondii]|uniref:uncharacterized protein LOC128041712 n=1 Tax=Gossypium raimondii TaxID=29730 RepID=UPI00227ACBE7|nr:uncharacterized protein LOC128041712 [Gossypium raimondii]